MVSGWNKDRSHLAFAFAFVIYLDAVFVMEPFTINESRHQKDGKWKHFDIWQHLRSLFQRRIAMGKDKWKSTLDNKNILNNGLSQTRVVRNLYCVCRFKLYSTARCVLLFVSASLDGSIGFILPITEKTYRRLLMLQNALNVHIPHTAGLNPKAYR